MPAEEMDNFRRVHKYFTRLFAVAEAARPPKLDELLKLAELIGHMKQIRDDLPPGERRIFAWEISAASASLKRLIEV